MHGLSASLLAAMVSATGILSMAVYRNWTQRNSSYFSAFAVGLLSVGVLFHLIPEALSDSTFAFGWIATGFTAMVLIGIAVQVLVGGRTDGAALTFGYASVIALAVHSTLDGFIYAASFHDDPTGGWIRTGGLLFHEFPEGVIAFALLTAAGLSRFRAVGLAFLSASVTTITGAIIANALISYGEPSHSVLKGMAAGALIYVLIVHLGPHAAKAPRKRGYDFAALGVLVGTIGLIFESLGGGH